MLSTKWQALCKTEKSPYRAEFMRRRTTNNEMSPGRANLVLWRRFGHGSWFVVQTATLASERRNQNLVRTLRAQRVEPQVDTFVSPPSLQSVIP